MVDDEQRQFSSGTNAALMNIIAMLVDELVAQRAFEKSALSERITQLADNLEADPDETQRYRDQTIVTQLRAFLQLLDFQPKPRWEPRVIE